MMAARHEPQLPSEAHLAPYATRSSHSRGRRYPEPEHAYRGCFQRDRDRIVHSSAFRRLSNKTQVFTGWQGDYHRTRLTHTLEVVSVARTLGRALRLNEDLVEALGVAHDLGHPPFGHAGEDTLNQCLATVGGFCHNQQGLRIVELLEQRYPDFPGLNLSAEVLDGQRFRTQKHRTQPDRAQHDPAAQSPTLEAQVVDAADGVAYDTHDADDALEAGLLELDELLEVPLWREAAGRVRKRWTALAGRTLKHAVLHELVQWQVTDLLANAQKQLAAQGIDSPDAVRSLPPIVLASDGLAHLKGNLEAFLYQRVYRHPEILALRRQAQAQLAAMYDRLVKEPSLMPAGFRGRMEQHGLERTVGDYLAGMTDRYAQQQYHRLCEPPH